MKVFVTGASGHIASYVIPELLGHGHSVVGLARSERSAAVIRALGADVWPGDLDNESALAAASREADAVIHLAFKHDEQNAGDLDAAVAADLAAVTAIGQALVGTGKPFVGTGATAGLVAAGHRGELTEECTRPGGPRVDTENTMIALAAEGVRSSVVRLPPAVHGGGRFGFVSGLLGIAERTGKSGYVGDGANRWPASGARDVARVYRLAMENAEAGSRLHAVVDEGIPLRSIADTIGRRLGVPVVPVAEEEAAEHFTFLTPFVGLDNPTSSHATQRTLGWTPEGPSLIDALLDQ